MTEKEGLYFLAIVPHDELANKITLIKEELAEKYNSKKALKGPPHITLQAPFRWNEVDEERIIDLLLGFAGYQRCFDVNLEGFNHFRNDTIYIDVPECVELIELHEDLQDFLVAEMSFTEDLLRHRDIHPHMTIAARDLKPQFEEAWAEFRKRNFKESFNATGMVLLKHDGTGWQLHRELSFGKN